MNLTLVPILSTHVVSSEILCGVINNEHMMASFPRYLRKRANFAQLPKFDAIDSHRVRNANPKALSVSPGA
jgi:hypothetical protein